MKDTLFEITNNLQGNNSRVNETKNLNDLEHKEAKKHHAGQEAKKKMRIVQPLIVQL